MRWGIGPDGSNPCDHSTGGGGGSAPSPILSWTTQNDSQSLGIGGDVERPGVSPVQFRGQLWIGYTTLGIDNNNAGNYRENGYPALAIFNADQSTTQLPHIAFPETIYNTAIASYNQALYIAFSDNFGNVLWTHSGDGHTWSNQEQFCTGNGSSGPSFVVFQGYLYLSVRVNGSAVLCRIDQNDNVTRIYPPTVAVNFEPGLGVYNNTLYIGFQPTDNSHNITLYTSTDGFNFTPNLGAAGDQTSTVPSFATHNGYLYIGFRTNDGDHKFLYKYSSDGSNFSETSTPTMQWVDRQRYLM